MIDVICPSDARYASVRHVYVATGSPSAVVCPRSAADVPKALAYARGRPGPLAIRSGGHGISSISTNTGGTVIDLGGLSGIEHLAGRRVRIGAGARWGQVARALYPRGLAISSGDSGDVGVGGLATTGGVGFLGRAHGLTIDQLVAADLVTADGSVRRVSELEHPELFWAVRGAGANIGIVTAFEFLAAPTPDIARLTVSYALKDVSEFLERWGTLVESSPRAISAFLYMGGGDDASAQATVVYAGDDQRLASSALQPFLDEPGVVEHRAEIIPYASVPLTTDASHSGQQSATAHTGLADHLAPELDTDLAELLRTGAADMVQIRSVGGAINDVPEDATAYAHRHQNRVFTQNFDVSV